MDFYTLLIEVKKALKLNYEKLGSLVDKNGDAMRKSISRCSLNKLEIAVLLNHFIKLLESDKFNNTTLEKKVKDFNKSFARDNSQTFNDLFPNNKSEFLEKDGVKVTIREMANFFVENEDVCLEDPIYKKAIALLVEKGVNQELTKIYKKEVLKNRN